MISQSCLHIRHAFTSWEIHVPVSFSYYLPMPDHKPEDREGACRMLLDWHLQKPDYQHFHSPEYKSRMMIAIAKQAKLNGVLLHYNRGCEGLSQGIADNRLAIQKAGFPVMTFEGNMGDEREFEEARTVVRVDAFMDTLGVKRVHD